MPQPGAGRAAWFGSVTLQLPLPTDNAGNSLRFGDCVIPSAGSVRAICLTAGTSISFIPPIVASRP